MIGFENLANGAITRGNHLVTSRLDGHAIADLLKQALTTRKEGLVVHWFVKTFRHTLKRLKSRYRMSVSIRLA